LPEKKNIISKTFIAYLQIIEKITQDKFLWLIPTLFKLDQPWNIQGTAKGQRPIEKIINCVF
jgi:hypothetical protein